LAGAGFAEFVRQWILISRRTAYDPDKPGHHELWLTTGGSAGHSAGGVIAIEEGSIRDDGGRRWEVAVSSIGKAIASEIDEKQAAKAARDREVAEKAADEVVAALTPYGVEGTTTRRLRELHRITGNRLSAGLGVALEQGRIESCLVTAGNKQEYGGYRVSLGTLGTTGNLTGIPDVPAVSGDAPSSLVTPPS